MTRPDLPVVARPMAEDHAGSPFALAGVFGVDEAWERPASERGDDAMLLGCISCCLVGVSAGLGVGEPAEAAGEPLFCLVAEAGSRKRLLKPLKLMVGEKTSSNCNFGASAQA